MGFQPEVKFIDPVIARFALFAHAEAISAGAKGVEFRLVACILESVVEAGDERPCACIVLRLGRWAAVLAEWEAPH